LALEVLEQPALNTSLVYPLFLWKASSVDTRSIEALDAKRR
jgi:hypothetical protein